MRSVLFPLPSPKFAFPAASPTSDSRHSSPFNLSLSDSLIEGNMGAAGSIITKWDLESPSYASLFYENRQEAREFLGYVRDLQRSMHFYLNQNSNSEKLVHAQILMQTAMKRLQKEFYQILAANREQVDPESVSARRSATTRSSLSDYGDDVGSEAEIRIVEKIHEIEHEASTTMSDLQAIADCMISCGYGKECVKIYKIIRKSTVDEGMYRLGFHRQSSKRIEKMAWDALELKIKNWVNTMKISIKTLFHGERILCDHVFASSKAIQESCFSDIVKEAALELLSFPEAVAKCSKAPEKVLLFLDIYETISELWPDIESIFSFESLSAVRTQANVSLVKLEDAIRAILAKFESAMEKDSSKSPVPGGDLHPLTLDAMNYICLLGDYSQILANIFADFPLQVQSSLQKAFLQNSPSPENPLSAISSRFEWLILVILCKLDRKAKLYTDVGLSYLFLTNNLQYVVSKVRRCNLHHILGSEWVVTYESKVQQYAANYERMAWNKATSALPENPTADIPLHTVKKRFREFNSAFESAYQKHHGWVVTDCKLREEIKLSLAKKIVPVYRPFYQKYRVLLRSDSSIPVRYAPEDLENYISGLFLEVESQDHCPHLHQTRMLMCM